MRTFFMTTGRIGFSKWAGNDFALAESLWGDPSVSKYICASGKFSVQEIWSRLELEINNERSYRFQYWPIFERHTCAFIGCCGLRPCGKQQDTLELGIHLKKEFWRQGYGTEAASCVIDYAFDELKISALIAGHHPDNTASAKLIRKLGFQYIKDQFYPPTGLIHPSYRLRNEK